MDTVIGIFTELKVDSTIVYQLVIVFTMFFLMKALFLSKLQSVLEVREEKTTKLEGSADAKLEEFEKLSRDYETKIATANSEAQKILGSGKAEFKKEQDSLYKKNIEKVNAEIDSKRDQMLSEIDKEKSAILASSDDLSKSLLHKMTVQ